MLEIQTKTYLKNNVQNNASSGNKCCYTNMNPKGDVIQLSYRSKPEQNKNLKQFFKDFLARAGVNKKGVNELNLTPAMNKGLHFGEDLTKLVKSENATPEEIQKLVIKHFNNQNIKVHSMDEYYNHGPSGVKKEQRAATTRPFFDKDGKLEKIDIFLPNLDYKDPHAVIEYIDKTSHEFTHVAQMLERDGSNIEYLRPTTEGRLLNFMQKSITDKFTDKLVVDAATALIKETSTPIKTIADYDKFMDTPSNLVSKEKIGEILKLGTDETTQKNKINQIFNFLFDSMVKQMQHDPNVQNAIYKYGGYEGLRNEIKSICAKAFKDEQEAYKTGQIMRQQVNGTTGKTTNNDLIHIIMGMCSDALN